MTLFAAERDRLGVQAHERASDAIAAAHEVRMAALDHRHDVGLTAADAAHAQREAARQQAHDAALALTTAALAQPALAARNPRSRTRPRRAVLTARWLRI